MLPVLVLWANLHGSVVLGAGLTMLLGLVVLVRDRGDGGDGVGDAHRARGGGVQVGVDGVGERRVPGRGPVGEDRRRGLEQGGQALTAEDLTDAPTLASLIDWLAALTAGRVIVAHNAPFDLTFLTAEH